MYARHRRRSLIAWLAAIVVALSVIPASIALADGGDGSSHGFFGGWGQRWGVHQFGGGALQSLTATNDCTLKVPADPLTPQGLATPYVLASGNDGTVCSETDEGTAAFVQATIFDPATGALSVYDPVVRDAGKALLGTAPPVPTLPAGAVITIWTGFNDNVMKLVGPGAGEFVNFAQQGYAFSPRFFEALKLHHVTAPPLGTAKDGKTCPSPRDFSIVDQDQSDNNVESYPAYGVVNGSDEALLTEYVDPAIGCTPWNVPLISGAPGAVTPSGPLEEYQASLDQAAPIALVPGLDDFVTLGGQGPVNGGVANLFLQDLYRAQVDQPITFNGNDTKAYCLNMEAAVPRIKALAPFETGAPPPFAAIAPTLGQVIQLRFEASWAALTCQALTGVPSPY